MEQTNTAAALTKFVGHEELSSCKFQLRRITIATGPDSERYSSGGKNSWNPISLPGPIVRKYRDDYKTIVTR
jgi:hypothetical protein